MIQYDQSPREPASNDSGCIRIRNGQSDNLRDKEVVKRVA